MTYGSYTNKECGTLNEPWIWVKWITKWNGQKALEVYVDMCKPLIYFQVESP